MLCYKTRKEIAYELGISLSTLNRKLKEKGITPPARRPLSPQWQKVIYQHCFWPDSVDKEDFAEVPPPETAAEK